MSSSPRPPGHLHRDVGGDVDRAAAATPDPHAPPHVLGVHARGEDVPAVDAVIVVLAVAAEHGPVRILLNGRAAVHRHLPVLDVAHGPGGHQMFASFPV